MGWRQAATRAIEWLTLGDLGPGPAAVQFSETAPMPIDEMWREMTEAATAPIGRAEMLTIPGVLRARDMICNIATLPLVELDSGRRPVENRLLEQFDRDVPNVVHLAQTVEDLWADGIAWWQVLARDNNNKPTWVRRCAPESVIIQPRNDRRMPAPLPHGKDPRGSTMFVDGVEVTDVTSMIRFDSPKQPARVVVARAMRQARDYDDAGAMYAKNPRPLDYFTPSEFADDPLDTEIRGFLGKWRRYRRQHSTGYVPKWAKLETVDAPTPANLQLVQLQQWVTVQLAVALGLDAEDFGVSTTSRTYQNAVDRRMDRINDVLAFFMRAITDRLTMPDITRRGNHVQFRLDDYLRADPKTRWETYQAQHNLFGDAVLPEIREQEDRPALAPPPAGRAPVVPLRSVGTPDRGSAAGRPGTAAGRDASRPAAIDASLSAGSDGTGITALQFGDDAASGLTFTEGAAHTFAVDVETRTIRGLAVPYGPRAIAVKNGRRFRVNPGALILPDKLSLVKLCEDHNYAAAFGHLFEAVETPEGLVIAGKVGRGAHGDRMLQLAEDKVKDGLSIGIEWDGIPNATMPDPLNPGVILVMKARLREVTQTAMPTFTTARLTSVAASHDNPEGPAMHCALCGQEHAPGVACTPTTTTATATAPAPVTAAFGVDQLAAMLGNPQLAAAFAAYAGTAVQPAAGSDGASAADPTATATPAHLNAGGAGGAAGTSLQTVREPSPYQFGFSPAGDPVMVSGQFDLSGDLVRCRRAGDLDIAEPQTDAGRRVQAFFQETFAVVATGDVNELNPTINRPDMYVDQREYRTPLWNSVAKGAPPNGVQPFMFPKFNTASGLVGDHTEGVEPTGGAMTTTGQTVQPTALSGAVDIPREVFDMGGNPAVSTLIWNQMRRAWREGLESATATFLATLTAATDITLGVAATDAAFIAAWEDALAELQFTRGYDFEMLALEKVAYKKFAAAKYSSGEPAYPILNPSNRNGTASSRFRTLDLAGVTGVPSWALASTPGALNSSWLYDTTTIHGWATVPQRLEFAGIDADGDYAPIAMIRIGAWGYKAFANSDIGGVRQVTYDSVA
jgi:hypothetical protein